MTSQISRVLTIAATIATVTVAASCGSTTPPSSSAPSAGTDQPSASAGGSPSSTVSVDPGTPPPSADSAEATAAAKTIFTAWSDRSLSYDAWWSQLSPMLSAGGKALYQYTDPKNIPELKVTGPYQVTDEVKGPNATAPGGANVAVPTSKGRFIVQLEHFEGEWLMYGLIFPEGVQ